VRRGWAGANVHNLNNPHWCRWCMVFSSILGHASSCANGLCTAVLAHGKSCGNWLRCLRSRPVTPTPHPETKRTINTDDCEVLRPAFLHPSLCRVVPCPAQAYPPRLWTQESICQTPTVVLRSDVCCAPCSGRSCWCKCAWGFPLLSFIAMHSSFSTGCTTRLSQCHLPSQRHVL
jgi:hypothetical protein